MLIIITRVHNSCMHKCYKLLLYLVVIVYESFKDYVAVETLEGENKYDAEKYGLQVSY